MILVEEFAHTVNRILNLRLIFYLTVHYISLFDVITEQNEFFLLA